MEVKAGCQNSKTYHKSSNLNNFGIEFILIKYILNINERLNHTELTNYMNNYQHNNHSSHVSAQRMSTERTYPPYILLFQ